MNSISILSLQPAYIIASLYIYIFYTLFSPILAIAETNSDSEVIFNWGESNFSQFFPEHRLTLITGSWKFRHYPSTNVFLGVKDGQVYVLGGPFGNEAPRFVATVSDLRAQINNDPGVPACNSPEDGFTVTQNANVLNITSNGQCLTIPDDICQTSFASAPTGSSVLSTTTLTSASFAGAEFEDPSVASKVLELFNTEMGDKLCTINTPADLINLVTNTNICRNRSLPARGREFFTQGRSTTHKFTATITNQLVSDCFATDADVVFDLFTGESWIRQEDGSFTKNPGNTTPGQLMRQVKSEQFNEDLNSLLASGVLESNDSLQEDGPTLAKNSGCLNCHNIDTNLVGPAFTDIAAKYSSDPNAIQYLSNKIMNGSFNVWGPILMPPNAMLNEVNAILLAEWIISLDNTILRRPKVSEFKIIIN